MVNDTASAIEDAVRLNSPKSPAGPLENPPTVRKIPVHDSTSTAQETITPPLGFVSTSEVTADAEGFIYEGPSGYISAGSHGVTPTWTEASGVQYFVDAAPRHLTPDQLDELIACLANVRQQVATSEAA